MPSWVVPAVAAELWGVSVEHILAEVAAGRVISRTEGEFLFVDVDPNAATVEQAETRPVPYRRSLAWALGTSPHVQQPIVTPAERDALLSGDDVMLEHDAGRVTDIDMPFGDAPAPSALTEDDTPDWEAVRARVSRTRIPPRSSRQAA